MGDTRTMKTTLLWHDSRGGECEAEVKVTYTAHKGYEATLVDPSEPPSVEIQSIVDSYGDSVPDHFMTDEDLMAECLQDYAEYLIEAAEYRAEMRAEALREGW